MKKIILGSDEVSCRKRIKFALMEMQTERLLIRNFEINDAKNLFELDSDPEVVKFIGGTIPKTLKDSTDIIERQLHYYKKNKGLGIFPAVLVKTNEFIGWCALKHLDASDKIEVGFRLKKIFWGNGYATELIKALLEYAFENLKLSEVYAVTHPENFASQRVLEKAGLKFIGSDNYYNEDLNVYKIANKNILI